MRKCNQGKSKVHDLSRKENVTAAAKQLTPNSQRSYKDLVFKETNIPCYKIL